MASSAATCAASRREHLRELALGGICTNTGIHLHMSNESYKGTEANIEQASKRQRIITGQPVRFLMVSNDLFAEITGLRFPSSTILLLDSWRRPRGLYNCWVRYLRRAPLHLVFSNECQALQGSLSCLWVVRRDYPFSGQSVVVPTAFARSTQCPKSAPQRW